MSDTEEAIEQKAPHKIVEDAVSTATANDSYLNLSTELKNLEKLPIGWDGYDAAAPNEIATYWCQEVIEVLEKSNLLPTGLTPSVEGGVGVYFQKGNNYADIECLNTGTIIAVMSDRRHDPIVWEIEHSRSHIKEAVETISAFLGD